jgi:HPt (histidine-containing phosphotransfer) domain-containing protein
MWLESFSNEHLNAEQLQDLTGGKANLIQRFCELFIECVDPCIEEIHHLTTAGTEAEWRSAAHAIKGAASNMGADRLAALCQEAQLLQDKSESAKQEHYKALLAEYNQVKKTIETIISNITA